MFGVVNPNDVKSSLPFEMQRTSVQLSSTSKEEQGRLGA